MQEVAAWRLTARSAAAVRLTPTPHASFLTRSLQTSPRSAGAMPSIASSSSGPLVSIMTVEPLAAASIITPMMLLALTRRPLRDIQTSHWYWPASWVSLADARACRPELVDDLNFQLLHFPDSPAAFASHLPRRRRWPCVDHDLERFLAVGERTHQHGQVHARDTFHPARDQQLRRRCWTGVAPYTSVSTSTPSPWSSWLHQLDRLRQDLLRIVVNSHADLHQVAAAGCPARGWRSESGSRPACRGRR